MWQDITANHLRVEQIGANIYSSVTTWPTVYLRATKIHMTETRMEKKKSANFLILKMCNISVAILKPDLFLVCICPVLLLSSR